MADPAPSVSIGTGLTVVTASAPVLTAAENDLFCARGQAIPIASRQSPTQITLKQPWPVASLVGEQAFNILSLGEYWRSAISINKRFADLLSKWEVVSPFRFDAAGTLAQRDGYNDQPRGFVYISLDPLPVRLFMKLANTNSASDWSLDIYIGSGGQVEFQEALDQERQQRIQADAALGQRIDSLAAGADPNVRRDLNAEIVRSTGRDAQHDDLIAGLRTDLATESSGRTSADTALGNRIDAETSVRIGADNALGGRVDTEINARLSADATLGIRIDAEASARIAADTAEASTRLAADNALGTRIDAEAAARTAADVAFDKRLSFDEADLAEGVVRALAGGSAAGTYTPAGLPIERLDDAGALHAEVAGNGQPVLAGGASTGEFSSAGLATTIRDADGLLHGEMAGLGQPVLAGGAPLGEFAVDGYPVSLRDTDGLLHAEIAGLGQPVLAGGLSFAIVGANGGVSIGCYPDGAGLAAALVPIVNTDEYGTDAALVSDTGAARLSYDDGAASYPQMAGNVVGYSRFLNGAVARRTINLAGEIQGLDPAVTKLRMSVADGQSLSVDYIASVVPALAPIAVPAGRAFNFAAGQNCWLDVTPIQRDRLQTVVPASEVTAGQQDQSSGNALMAKLLGAGGWGAGDAVLYASFGIGGQPYSVLRRGGQPWRNLLDGLLAGLLRAFLAGLDFSIEELFITHGEADDAAGATQAQYYGYLIEWGANYVAATHAISEQTYDPLVVVDQCSSWCQSGNSGPALAQLQVCGAQPSRYVFAGPKYHLPYSDGRHLTRAGYRRMREYQALAARRKRAGQVPALRPLSATRSGATITVTCEVPVGPLVIDAALVSDPGSYGVTFSQTGGNTVTVQSVSVSGSTITVTLSATPTGTGMAVNFALATTTGAQPGPTSGPRCCIHDSTTETGADGTVLHSYMPHAVLPVT